MQKYTFWKILYIYISIVLHELHTTTHQGVTYPLYCPDCTHTCHSYWETSYVCFFCPSIPLPHLICGLSAVYSYHIPFADTWGSVIGRSYTTVLTLNRHCFPGWVASNTLHKSVKRKKLFALQRIHTFIKMS